MKKHSIRPAVGVSAPRQRTARTGRQTSGRRSFLCAVVCLALSACNPLRDPIDRQTLAISPVRAMPAPPQPVYAENGMVCLDDQGQHQLADVLEGYVLTHRQAVALRELAIALDIEASTLLDQLNAERLYADHIEHDRDVKVLSWQTGAIGLGIAALACGISN